MTRSKELRRIKAAIASKNEAELRWALGQCEIRKKWQALSGLWYRIEKEIRKALDEIQGESN
jgi:hypothetical protein